MTQHQKRRILAVDFGDRRTGLAGTDFSGTIVVPLKAIHGQDDQTLAKTITALAEERGAEVVVVGLPLDATGGVGARAKRTMTFVTLLRGCCKIPVETVDETHSTDEAHARLKEAGLKAARRKQLADSVAAMVILERFRYGC